MFDDPQPPRRRIPIHRRIFDWFDRAGARLAHFLGESLESIEAFFRRLGRGVGGAFADLGAVLVPHTLLARIAGGWQVFWWRAISTSRRGATLIPRILLPRRAVLWLNQAGEQTWRRLFNGWARLMELLGRLAERFLPDWLRRGLGRLFHSLGRVAFLVTDFFYEWWFSRSFRKLLAATPVFVLSLPLMACMVLVPLNSNAKKIRHYQMAMRNALEEDRNDQVDLFTRKLSQLGDQRLERSEYQAALALASQEKHEEAYERMKQLAPESSPGFAWAHIWIAGAILEGNIDVAPQDPWRLIDTHARHAMGTQQIAPLARRLLVEVDLRLGRTREAIDRMQSLAAHFPELHVTMMQVFRELGDVKSATSQARDVVEFYQELDEKDGVELSGNDYYQWAIAHGLLGNRGRMESILAAGIDAFPNEGRLRDALGGALIARHDQLIRSPIRQAGEARELLWQAFDVNPNGPEVARRLGRQLFEDENSVRPLLQRARERNGLSAEPVMLAGDFAFQANDLDRALRLYQEATALNPDDARAWNNVAWIQAFHEPRKLPEAIAAANRAVELDPHPRFLETRGQILFELQRWAEAVIDLEQALNGNLPERSDAHFTLAQAYEKLGELEQAAAHRALAGR